MTSWNDPARIAALVEAVNGAGSTTLIGNLTTEMRMQSFDGIAFPVSLSTRQNPLNCYISDPVAALTDYARFELHALPNRAARTGAGALISLVHPLVAASGLGHQVQVNDWLVSTNPVPPLRAATAAAIRDDLTASYPDRAVVMRSLNEGHDAASLAALRDAGFTLMPMRQVWLTDPQACAETRDLRRDLRALERTGFAAKAGDAFTDADFARAARLYGQLYLEKYTPLNPQYTPRYIKAMQRAGVLTLTGWYDPAGEMVAVGGLFRNGPVLTQPLLGYDLARPASDGLYRLVTAHAFRAAREARLQLNSSAGAARFKRLRGARPAIEYTAIYAAHLPRRQRLAIGAIAEILRKVGVPLIRRYQL
ncbi:GNAT family N-acetyltransferase [Paracoccaceae bacterium GXU_MW_L88]